MITTIAIIIWAIYFVFMYFVIFWLLTFIEVEPEIKKNIMEYPDVTIAIPAYNEEKTIAKTIQSVIELEYPKNKIEIIIVNDGSNDNTAEIVKEQIKIYKESNIILINQKNGGKGKALNAALKKAKGKYFVSLDADSFVRKDALKVILPYFIDENIAAVLPLLKIKKPNNLLDKKINGNIRLYTSNSWTI